MREAKYRQAAWAYGIYGIVYLVGAAYLTSLGLGARGGAWWLIVGVVFVAVFPWAIARGPRGPGYVWFTRILALFMLVRVIGVARVAWAPAMPTVPLPGGGAIPMSLGAALFALIALAAAFMVARAGWNLPP